MSTGWIFKKPSKRGMKKAHLNKFRSDLPKVKSKVDTPRARVLAEDELGGQGATVLYRDHIKPPGAYLKSHNEGGKLSLEIIDTTDVPLTKFLSTYTHMKVEDRPPVVNVILRRIQVRLEILNPRRTALEKWNYYKVVDEVYHQLVCYFSGNKAFFVDHDEINMVCKMSRMYDSGRAREIVQRKLFDRITWFHKDTIP